MSIFLPVVTADAIRCLPMKDILLPGVFIYDSICDLEKLNLESADLSVFFAVVKLLLAFVALFLADACVFLADVNFFSAVPNPVSALICDARAFVPDIPVEVVVDAALIPFNLLVSLSIFFSASSVGIFAHCSKTFNCSLYSS